jgi:hypothetical protein
MRLRKSEKLIFYHHVSVRSCLLAGFVEWTSVDDRKLTGNRKNIVRKKRDVIRFDSYESCKADLQRVSFFRRILRDMRDLQAGKANRQHQQIAIIPKCTQIQDRLMLGEKYSRPPIAK